MSGVVWVQKAMETADPTAADRLLLEAIRVDPDLGQAYGMRARLAVMRGDAVTAAHYFRVAYARGDRSPEARVGLALCLVAAEQVDLADRVRDGIPVPPSLEHFEDACELQARPIRRIMSIPLPPKGEAALLPGEKLPSPLDTSPQPEEAIRATAEQASFQLGSLTPPEPTPGAAVRVVRGPLPTDVVQSEASRRFTGEQRGLTLPRLPGPTLSTTPGMPSSPAAAAAVSLPPAAAAAVASLPPPPVAAVASLPPPPAAPPAAAAVVSLPPPPAAPPAAAAVVSSPPPLTPPPPHTAAVSNVPAMPLRRRVPDWVDQIDRSEIDPPPRAAAPDWITDNVPPPDGAAVVGAIEMPVDNGDEPLIIGHDPGAPDFSFRSSITGRVIRPDELVRERAESRMPTLEPVPDLLARAQIFADLIDTRRLFAALELPGPVLTVAGAQPRPLCRLMAFGATPDELFFRDIERDGLPPVRLARASITRMDVVNDDQQISFVLGDGRQLHLDLRAIARSHSPTVRQLVRRLREMFPEAP